MFNVNDTLVYKGHGLVKIIGKTRKDFDGVVENYYLFKSSRTPMMQTKMMVKLDGAEKVLRHPISEQEAGEVLEILGGAVEELQEDPKERMEMLDEILDRNDIKEFAALVRDYRESRLLNLERPEIKRVKAISRNIAEELCFVLKINRSAIRDKLFVRPAV